MEANQRKLDDENKAIAKLETFYTEVKSDWSDIKLYCNIGHIQYTAPITVDVEGGTSIPRTGGRSWSLRRRSGVSLRATSSISVRFDSPFSFLSRLTKTTLFRIEVFC